MFRMFRDRSIYHRRSFLCFVFIFVLAVCAAFENPELDQSAYAGLDGSGSIASPKKDYNDVFTNEFTGYSVVKCITSRNSDAGRFAGSGTPSVYAVIKSLLVLIGTFALFRIYFYRPVLTSHRLIITYIHDLDGMKP